MKERPILFSGEMVRAILEGRKTQTRRVCQYRITGPNPPNPPGLFDMYDGDKWIGAFPNGNKHSSAALNCPHGQPGDRLWVRETLQHWARNNPAPRHNHLWRYRADNALVMVAKEHESDMRVWAHHKDGDICVSIHMPRWASRLTLEITNVRLERVQEISQEDAIAEGIELLGGDNNDILRIPVCAYAELWDEINAKRGCGWDNNHWVWVIEFKQVTP